MKINGDAILAGAKPVNQYGNDNIRPCARGERLVSIALEAGVTRMRRRRRCGPSLATMYLLAFPPPC